MADLHSAAERDVATVFNDLVRQTVDRIKPMLAGLEPAAQGAALADCLALWLTCHYVPGDEDATSALRSSLLDMHINLVRALTSANADFVRELASVNADTMGTA